jgi:hypothetical protein
VCCAEDVERARFRDAPFGAAGEASDLDTRRLRVDGSPAGRTMGWPFAGAGPAQVG